MSSKLPNYIRTYRRRCGFSQAEIAFLLGVRFPSKASRYERFTRKPSLITVLALEVIFKLPARELFAGLYEKIERDVSTRAKVLGHRTSRLTPSRVNFRKLAALKAIIIKRTKK